MAETKVKVKFYMGDEQDLVDYKGARGAEALVAGFEKSRAQSNAGFDTEFKKSYKQTTYKKQDLEAQTTHMDDNETICDSNVNTFTKLFRVLCDLF
jgi:hypothetical protein